MLKASGTKERFLRSKQIGTPIVAKENTHAKIPQSVDAVLENIRSHGSYASERYYAKTFKSYFAEMTRAVERMASWLRPDGILILVIQDSIYKDIYVPTASLVCDITESAGLRFVTKREWHVRKTISRIRPKAALSTSDVELTEAVLAFSK